MIKAVFFDIDGTLIDPVSETIPQSALDSLHALRRKGIKVFVATGRVPAMLDFLEEFFSFDGFVGLNGQLVMERGGKILHRMAHEKSDIRKLVALVREKQFPCLINEEQENFMVTDHPIIRQHFDYEGGLPTPPLYEITRLEKHDVLQFLVYMPLDPDILMNCLEHIEVTSAGYLCYDVIPKKGGKEVGISAAAKHYGISQDEIMVFGDGDNDMRMLAWAGIGVAMGNAPDHVKKTAAYVTDDAGKDGIQKALLHFGVLSPDDID